MRQDWWVAAVLGISAAAMAAQQPKVVNARFRTEPAGADLGATVIRLEHENGPLWLGYEVAAQTGSHFTVCSGDNGGSTADGCCGVYRLEESDNTFRNSDQDQAAESNLDVLVRIDKGGVDKVRFIGPGCQIDAGGLEFVWLTEARTDDSVAWLGSLVNPDQKRLSDQALAALSMHRSEKATPALARLASSPSPLWLREKAAFWLGAGRGHEGYLALEKLEADPDAEFRKKLAFDLSITREPKGVDDLIRMARSDTDTGVREQAIFWVAQKAGKKAIATLKSAVEDDPEEAVKKKAVFALSQLPKDEAVPELLHVAETNPNPAVRKDAIFWLGQTHDPRALAYFEKILER